MRGILVSALLFISLAGTFAQDTIYEKPVDGINADGGPAPGISLEVGIRF